MVGNNTFHWVQQPDGSRLCIPNYSKVFWSHTKIWHVSYSGPLFSNRTWRSEGFGHRMDSTRNHNLIQHEVTVHWMCFKRFELSTNYYFSLAATRSENSPMESETKNNADICEEKVFQFLLLWFCKLSIIQHHKICSFSSRHQRRSKGTITEREDVMLFDFLEQKMWSKLRHGIR